MTTARFLFALLSCGVPLTATDWAALRGVNYFTAAASNAHEMWMQMDAAAVDREIGWAEGLGFNSLRLWLSVPAYEASPSSFKKNLDHVLSAAAKHNLSAMLVLFDNCGIPARKDAVEMTVHQAYKKFTASAAFAPQKDRIVKTYGEFAERSGRDMLIKVGHDTPPDILFWQNWTPNPGLDRMQRASWPAMEQYVDAVLEIARKHSNVIAIDVFNEPGVIFDRPAGMNAKEADAVTLAFIEHFTGYLRKQKAPAPITIGSENTQRMKALAQFQDVLSVHTYRMGDRLDATLAEAKAAAQALGKPLIVTECLANTDNWLDVRHGEESRSTDEAQLRHYQDNLPRFLKSGLGWYSWGFLAGRMFTPFTDILYPNGFRRPAAVYLQTQLKPKPATNTTLWPREKAIYEVNLDYYPGHSFKDLAADLPRIKDLGANVIYLMPFWESAEGARYLVNDYFKIDARYGTGDDLKALTAAAHRLGMRLVIDFVTSLVYDGSVIYKEHPDFVLKGDNGEPQRFYPFKDWGWALDCAKPEVIEYFSKIVRHYIEQYDVDGLRVDSPMNNYDPAKVSGDHSRVQLLRSFKAAAAQVKPNALFVCELSGPTLMWGTDDANEVPLYDEVCQASYHFEFSGFFGGKKEEGFHYVFFEGSPAHGKLKLTLLDKVVYNKATSAELTDFFRNQKRLAGAVPANFIENHDTERVSYGFPQQHRALFLLNATLPGVPVVHAGQEIGTTNPGGHYMRKPDVSNVIPWAERDRDLEAFYKKVLTVREKTPALLSGDIRNALATGDRPYAFFRSYQDSHVLVAVNFTDKPATAKVALPSGTNGLKNLLTGESKRYSTPEVTLELPAYGHVLMQLEK